MCSLHAQEIIRTNYTVTIRDTEFTEFTDWLSMIERIEFTDRIDQILSMIVTIFP